MVTRVPTSLSAGDVLIIGGGLAGLFTALKLEGHSVTVLMADKDRQATASASAQGGLAAALGAGDSVHHHADDTVKAGDGLVDAARAHSLASEAPARIEDLARLGIAFNQDETGAYHLGREAAHSHNRIIGVNGDCSGKAIMQNLYQAAQAAAHIDFLQGYRAYELAVDDGRIIGVFVRPTHKYNAAPVLVRAPHIVLATGGVGHLYATTTNPPFANGEALAMAARAGAGLSDMEFVQFHPTAFCAPELDPAPLATEALRGEGAWLVNKFGERFMPQHHPHAELAPRDSVARAVFRERQRTGFVGLDMRGDGTTGLAENLPTRFPTVYNSALRLGIDPRHAPIPVAPAAHYHMGGVTTTAYGRTNIAGLWACGEVASTGVHGANRLASNSLVEALVFGARIAADIKGCLAPPHKNPAIMPRLTDHSNKADIMVRLRQLMSDYVGVIRNETGLHNALSEIARLEQSARHHIIWGNICATALMIAASAYMRRESRGAHFRQDYPHKADTPAHSTITLEQAYRLAETGTHKKTLRDIA